MELLKSKNVASVVNLVIWNVLPSIHAYILPNTMFEYCMQTGVEDNEIYHILTYRQKAGMDEEIRADFLGNGQRSRDNS
jgi:hypothetical protein